MFQNLQSILRCPACAERLHSFPDFLRCAGCDRRFRSSPHFADLLAEDVLRARYGRRVEEWRRRLELLQAWRSALRARSEAAGFAWRPKASTIEWYLALNEAHGGRSRLLDVGCGSGRRAAHFAAKHYVGLDPLILNPPVACDMVKGVAEFLPFEEACFDAVLCVEVLDHVLDPERAITEMLRVLAVGGDIFIFVGSLLKDASAADRPFYCITEEEVHLAVPSPQKLQLLLLQWFEQVAVETAGGYLALYASGRRLKQARQRGS
jgi:ubiquinone/menaquinone biosynthesis C-methylase UbiE